MGNPPSIRSRANVNANNNTSNNAAMPISGGTPKAVVHTHSTSTPTTSPHVAGLRQETASAKARRADHRLNSPKNSKPPRACVIKKGK